MDINQIILIAIIVLIGIILVFGTYFLIVYFHNRKHEKKMDTIFNPNNLVEEESLMNYMDEKKNLDFAKETKENKNTFLTESDNFEGIRENIQISNREQSANPFGIDMTKRTKDNTPILSEEDKSQNKFIH